MRRKGLSGLMALGFLTSMLVVGCGDDAESPKPVTELEVSPHWMTIEISQAFSISATVSGGETKAVDWYVNGVPGGNSVLGTITQTNPAIYTSPDEVPTPETVVVKAVSQEDTSKVDSCVVRIQFTTVYVNGGNGDDENGTGGLMKPLRSIAKGLGIAESGMTVLVARGTYYEHDIVMKSGVTLRSETGEPDCVTIDAQRLSRIFDCDGVDSTGKIEGFTITGGQALGGGEDECGGAMWCRNSALLTVRNCVFVDNWADLHGGAVYCVNEARPRFIKCTFYKNHANSKGGVMLCGDDCFPTFINCTLSHNSARGSGGGIYIGLSSVVTLEGTIITFSSQGEAIYCQEVDEGIATLMCCNIYGNAGGDWLDCIADQLGKVGNFSADPLFCDTLSGDLTLESCSPCLPGNHPDSYDCGLIGAWGEGCSCK